MLVDVFSVSNFKRGPMSKLVVIEPGASNPVSPVDEKDENTVVIKLGTTNIASLHLITSKQSASTYVDRSGLFTGFTAGKIGGAWSLNEAVDKFNEGCLTVHCVDIGRGRIKEVHTLEAAIAFYND